MSHEVEKEIERLRNRKLSIISKINSAKPDDRESYERELDIIQNQIEILERYKK